MSRPPCPGVLAEVFYLVHLPERQAYQSRSLNHGHAMSLRRTLQTQKKVSPFPLSQKDHIYKDLVPTCAVWIILGSPNDIVVRSQWVSMHIDLWTWPKHKHALGVSLHVPIIQWIVKSIYNSSYTICTFPPFTAHSASSPKTPYAQT